LTSAGVKRKEEKEWVKRHGLVGLNDGTGWAAAKQGKEESGPIHMFVILQIKELSFELGFEIEFEFDSHSNSNFTHLNSKRTRENPTHMFYHNLNICFINGINWSRI
jgi:hypothetical protein